MSSENQQDLPIPFTAEDIRNFDFETMFSNYKSDIALGEVKSKTCFAYEHALTDSAKEFNEQGDEKSGAICTLFAYFCSFAVRLDTPRQPYRLRWTLDKPDIKESYAKLLLEVVNDLTNPELRARIADVLWVIRKGSYLTARLAIDAYLESAQNLEDPQNWVSCAERLERALQLAAEVDKNGDYFQKTIAVIESWLDKYAGNDPLFLSHKLMSLLIQYDQGDVNKYISLSGTIALNAEANNEWHKARLHWEIKAKWHFRDNDVQKANEARLQAAETYVSEAKKRVEILPPNYGGACQDLKLAIQGLRNYGGTPKRIEEIRKLLAEYQVKSNEELANVSRSVDVTEIVKKAVERVSGKSLREAILELAEMGHPLSKDEIQKQVIRLKEQNPFHFFIHAEILNEAGQTVASRPSAFSNDPEEADKATQAEMYRLAASYQDLQASAVITPALQQINSDFYIRESDLYEFVHNNPFIPPDREIFYLQGLQAGFSYNFLVASHLLIPQIENSIRQIFTQAGVITTNLDEVGHEEKKDLGVLLTMPQAKEIFGDDLIFTLRGLLIERFGTNMRNLFAHGLDTNILVSGHSIYLWGLCLFLCCSYTLAVQNKQASE